MLKIRLQRIGKRGQAYFRIVVTEHTQKPKGKYLELLGSYDPHKNKLSVDSEKVKHWLKQGAKMSETVNNLLVGRSVLEGEKMQTWKPKKKPAPVDETKQTSVPSQQAEIKKEEAKEPTPEMPQEETKIEEPVSAMAEAPAT